MNDMNRIWVIIPAAGIGSRMLSDIPKQYLKLNDLTVIEHTISAFDSNPNISEIIVAVSPEDEYWPKIKIKSEKPLHQIHGGRERCFSVLNALKFLKDKAAPADWILVHDAARPCLSDDDLNLLLNELKNDEVGGILAIPVRDTMKSSVASDNEQFLINQTLNRDELWHALTPQMFRYQILYDAIESALNKNELVTDESSALELAGYQPRLIEGHADNIKITRPEDLALAAFFLRQQAGKV